MEFRAIINKNANQLIYIINKNIQNSKFFAMNPNKFIIKLIEMMNQFPQIINWSFDGQEMEIFDIQKFQGQVYTKYFTSKNYKSFVRQLNMYNFRRISKGKNSASFKHQQFKRGNQAYFQNIKRRKQKNKPINIDLLQGTPMVEETHSLSDLTVADSQLFSIIEQIKMIISQRGLPLIIHLQQLLKAAQRISSSQPSLKQQFQCRDMKSLRQYASICHMECTLKQNSFALENQQSESHLQKSQNSIF